MTVPVGAIYGFIGENGSGKSTTEKLICGHLVPDGGEIKLFGNGNVYVYGLDRAVRVGNNRGYCRNCDGICRISPLQLCNKKGA